MSVQIMIAVVLGAIVGGGLVLAICWPRVKELDRLLRDERRVSLGRGESLYVNGLIIDQHKIANTELSRSLNWYAQRETWQADEPKRHSLAFKDRGKLARETLKRVNGSNET